MKINAKNNKLINNKLYFPLISSYFVNANEKFLFICQT